MSLLLLERMYFAQLSEHYIRIRYFSFLLASKWLLFLNIFYVCTLLCNKAVPQSMFLPGISNKETVLAFKFISFILKTDEGGSKTVDVAVLIFIIKLLDIAFFKGL